jgi:hypothetical protein
VALLSVWLILGLFLDGWAHVNLPGGIETFFTPWHAVFYAGFLALSGYHIIQANRNVTRGYSWRRVLPRGYGLSLLGIAVFGVAGALDFIWHRLFGFEVNVEALLSPSHLLLAVGGTMICLGPVRAAMVRSSSAPEEGWARLLPAVLSLFLFLSILMFFTQYVHFLTDPGAFIGPRPADTAYLDMLGVSSSLIQASLISGVVLFALRHWSLPLGSLLLIIGGSTLLVFGMRYGDNAAHPWLLVGVLIAAAVADVLNVASRPSVNREIAWRVFAFAMPFLVFLGYYVALIASVGTWWSVHLWLGVPVQAGIVGLLISYLLAPESVTHGA